MLGNRIKLLVSATTSIMVVQAMTTAQVTAWDDASHSNYNDGWQGGDNGGYGFGAWTINDNGGGHYVGSSLNNGGSPNIDTGSGRAFGLFSNGPNGTPEAYRNLNSALSTGQTFSISMDNGNVATGGTVGIALQTSGGTNRFELYFKGGVANYTVNASGGEQDSTVGWTNGGVRVVFSLLSGGNNAKVDIYQLATSQTTPAKTFSNLALLNSGGIARIKAFNAKAGYNSESDFFVNSMGVSIPEPSTFTVLTGGVVLASLRRKRR